MNPDITPTEFFAEIWMSENDYLLYKPRIAFYQQLISLNLPSPEVKTLTLIQSLQFEPCISVDSRALATSIFLNHGKFLVMHGIKPMIIALATFKIIEQYAHGGDFHIYRMAKQLHVSVARVYAVFHMLEAKIPCGFDFSDLSPILPATLPALS
jgi:hypothetical protein